MSQPSTRYREHERFHKIPEVVFCIDDMTKKVYPIWTVKENSRYSHTKWRLLWVENEGLVYQKREELKTGDKTDIHDWNVQLMIIKQSATGSSR